MPVARHLIVCEGESEWTYLKRLQAFLDDQELPAEAFETPLRFISPEHAMAKNGSYRKLVSTFKKKRTENRGLSIQVWADFDLFHRNDQKCATHYAAKHDGIPDFLFSFHNFEDFYALHFEGETLAKWLKFGSPSGKRHFTGPLHSEAYLREIAGIFANYKKNDLPADFITWNSLRNLKANLAHQPSHSNPHDLQGIGSFAEFLIHQIERAYPDKLNPAPFQAPS
jgi:hypothetical protein